MTFRSRLIVSFFLVSAIPILVLAYVVRTEMSERLRQQYEVQTDAAYAALIAELDQLDSETSERLDALKHAITDDNQFRLAVLNQGQDREYLLDYAENARRLNGLSAIQIQDEAGRIVSSGHFRNDFDRLDDGLVARMREVDSEEGHPTLVAMRTAEGALYVVARADSFRIGPRAFTLVAGQDIEEKFLRGSRFGADITISITLPDGTTLRAAEPDAGGKESLPPPDASGADVLQSNGITRSTSLPTIDASRTPSESTLRVRHTLAGLKALRARIDSWIAIVVGLATLLAIVLVSWNASLLSKPLSELATRAERVDLDRLDVDFKSSRQDEIGKLSNILGKMTRRLRASIVHLRDAERRATVGDLARQVNHDIKNGLTPIRNIVRHLKELSSSEPDQLAETFDERLPALDAGITYLESLSANYGRLSQPSSRILCDLGAIVGRVAGDYNSGRQRMVQVSITKCPPVLADPVALRRIIENLVSNALDSLEGGQGSVMIELKPTGEEASQSRVQLSVSDTGIGMTDEQKSRIFENFYTTRESGTGLGLSIVRRLIVDLGGSISVESSPGDGSRFTVELPAESSVQPTQS